MIGRQLTGVITAIDPQDGTQTVMTDAPEDHLKVMHLSGICRIQGAKLGDRVKLEYRRGGNYALWFGAIEPKSAGQLAYERDLQKTPTYPNGDIRPPWEGLSEIAQYSWERNPTDR